MKIQFYSILIFCICFTFLSCEKKIPATPKDLLKENLIPQPVEVKATGSSFRINNQTKILLSNKTDDLLRVGEYLRDILQPATGFEFQIDNENNNTLQGNIFLMVSNNLSAIGEEGYHLEIEEDNIKIEAKTVEGIFRGVQTFRQLFSEKIEYTTKQSDPWEIATGKITDFPNYEYRGAMLDVSRHFFGVEDVKRFIDWCARYKMNYVHLHLSDDQGWRIEIKKWHNLTKKGGSTEVDGGEGGFYTQNDYQEIVSYAQDRFITIVPEIDMPGHTNAALASYAELNCDGKARKLYTGTNVGFSTLCTTKEITYQFVEDVVRELSAITPGPYFHIGGDESDATEEKEYIKFINRVQDIVNKYDKQMMGWDDITAGQLKANSIAQHWAKEENAKNAVEQNVKLVMSPAKRAYLDMQYDSTTTLGLHWAGYVEVDHGYNWNPATMIPDVKKENILGVECPLWTETITNMEEMEYMVFPRLLGYAEIGWSQDSLRVWDEYKVRLGKHGERMKANDWNFYKSEKVPWDFLPNEEGLKD